MSKKRPLDEDAKRRIMSSESKRNGGQVPSKSDASKAQKWVDKRQSK